MTEKFYDPDQPRDERGRWGEGGTDGGGGVVNAGTGSGDNAAISKGLLANGVPIKDVSTIKRAHVYVDPDGNVVNVKSTHGALAYAALKDASVPVKDVSEALDIMQERGFGRIAAGPYEVNYSGSANITAGQASVLSQLIASREAIPGSPEPRVYLDLAGKGGFQGEKALAELEKMYRAAGYFSDDAHGEKLADLRGTGPTKRRKWEQAVNGYQSDLTQAYDDWANGLADDLEGATSDADANDIIDAALVELSATLAALGRKNITAGGAMALGKTIPTPGYLNALADRIQTNEGYIDDSLIPDIRNRLSAARMDPDVVATGATAFLGVLAAFNGRISSYAGSMWAAMQEAQGETAQAAADAGDGGRVAWQRDEQAQHCQDCLDFGADEYPGQIYDSWDDMMATTGDRVPGEVQCDGNCRCSLWVETAPDEWTREGYSSMTRGEQLMVKLEAAFELLSSRPPADVHVDAPRMPDIYVAAPVVNVAPPTVNVQPPQVTVAPPDVRVTVEAPRPPDVRVNVEATKMPDVHVTVQQPDEESPDLEIERDEAGDIKTIRKIRRA